MGKLIIIVLYLCMLSAPLGFAANASNTPIHNVADDKNVGKAKIIDRLYRTPLDHFTPTDARRVEFNYQSNNEFYRSGNPIFIYINDGAGIRWITSGLVYDLARELQAGLVTSSNRFFGRNTFLNTTIENLRYLTLDNMLGDVAHLVTKVREDYRAPNARVIVWGNRLGATTAALARKKFPHLIDGAWSSSGLFRAFLPEATYFHSVSANIKEHGSAECGRNLNNILNQIRRLVETRNGERLTQLFRLCEPINFNDSQSVTFFYVSIFRFIASHLENSHYNGIQQICRDITLGTDPVKAFVRWIDYEFSTNDVCRNINYSTWITRRRDTGARNMGRSTTWYYCTQFAFDFFITTHNSIFPDVINESYYNRLCSDTFGSSFNFAALSKSLDNFNVQHGAQNQVITNTIFSNGKLDPLLAHGMLRHRNFVSEVVLTGLYGVESDLGSLSSADSVELYAAKNNTLAALRRFARGE